MALLLMEGFDHENLQADMASGILFLSGGGAAGTLASTTSRWGVGKYLVASASGAVGFNLPVALATGFAGCAVRSNGTNTLSFSLWDGPAAAAQVTLNILNTGALEVRRGAGLGGTLLGTTGVVLNPLSWNYIEIGATISATVGTVTIQVNGLQVLALTGQNTKGSTATTFSAFAYTNSTSVHIDDLYICDATGAAPNNTFLGDVKVQTLFPTANDAVQFTPLASTNWSQVSETAMDSDTSYNSSATAGQQDTFTHGALSGTPTTIFGVQVTSALRKDDASTHTAKNVLLSGASAAAGATVPVASGYTYQKDIFATDPATSAAWTIAGVNASRHGYNLVS